MTIQADVVSTIEGAGIGCNADYVPQGVTGDFVVVKRSAREPTNTLGGIYDAPIKSTFDLLCVAESKADAATLAASVTAAIKAGTVIKAWFFEPVSDDEFDPESMDNAEVVRLSIWH